MNKQQRKQLQEAQQMLDKASAMLYDAMSIIEEIKEAEHEKFDNANEGLQSTERYQEIDEKACALDDLYDTLESIKDEIDDAYNDESFEG